MYSRLVKILKACIQVVDGHYPGTGWPLSRNWMATIQQLDGHLLTLHDHYTYSQICTAGWQRHPVKCIQVLNGHCPPTGRPSSNITWSLHIQSDMYSRLVKILKACIQVVDGHCPGTGWPLSRNWMATIQQLDGHCPGTGWPPSNITWSLHMQSDMYSRLVKILKACIQVVDATVQELDGHCPATGWPLSSNWMATF